MARVVNFASVTLDRVIEHMEAWHYNEVFSPGWSLKVK